MEEIKKEDSEITESSIELKAKEVLGKMSLYEITKVFDATRVKAVQIRKGFRTHVDLYDALRFFEKYLIKK